jgi:predicted ATPase
MALRGPLPSGVVTLLFTDIEGSTQRWERYRAAMPEALRRHDELLRTAIEARGGHVFKTVGDAFCAAFARAADAVLAATEAQRALAAEDWRAVDGLTVRMALHSGLTDERDNDYFGPTVNRVARLLAVGHGGQVLISRASMELIGEQLPAEHGFLDLGEHRLKDLTQPERVHQLVAPDLALEFPPLRSLDHLSNNLPAQVSSFVGRENDIADVLDLLERHRLVTLVGAGGVGKTRLALHVGADLLHNYSDGVWFVDLARISESDLVSSVTAQALGMSQQQGSSIGDAIPQWLKKKRLLLIFDNCEHVVETVAELAASILAIAPKVRILATSRQPLAISGEAAHRLPSLPHPADAPGLTADEALRYGAIVLFAERAKAADARFALTDTNARTVADICRRLDGIPFAIELAAARVKMLSVASLAQRLDERFRLLTGGNRDVMPRQKTLSALIDWSYDLLGPSERLLFARLGIFAGGFSLHAVTNVCGGEDLDEIDILDLLGSLTDKSLVVADVGGEHERYRLLESTAAYARDKVRAVNEHEALARRHAEYFRDQARGAADVSGRGSTLSWLAASGLELDNDRKALAWALTQDNDAALGGVIAGSLAALWIGAGLAVEGRYWITLALERLNDSDHPHVRLRLWLALGDIALGPRKYEAAEQALRLSVSVGDDRSRARAQRSLAFSLLQMGRHEEAVPIIERALALARACGDSHTLVDCLQIQGNVAWRCGDARMARELLAQALAAFRSAGNETAASGVLGSSAEMEFACGNFEQAARANNEALAIDEYGQYPINVATGRTNGAAYLLALGDVAAARDFAREGLHVARRVGFEQAIVVALQHLALLSAMGGASERAARLLGYVDAQYVILGMQREYTETWGYDRLMAALHETLDTNDVARLAAEGAAWSEDQAVEQALAV